ncbi:transposase [Chryseobacterium pennipullorum]|uniref:Transposase n=1 Tax=Chryseobacterium pennipullorum TaxID=2258963 RepID=A0A3D9AVR7_9FLAO|nr:transposase [Chryseobacterium pennipullorum]REC45393.1 transposase [Chryseobacterium pennipullorum]
MKTDFKNIHIGNLIENRVNETSIELERISNFMKCEENELKQMYKQEHLPADILLKWSKLLEYDFFRIYSQHLVLYAPQQKQGLYKQNEDYVSSLPKFRKNVYTKEIISFMLELIHTRAKTKQQIIDEYKIPKTTLYKWIEKYNP